MEIQRLIGRALRSVVDRRALGERTIWVDCEVLQADGGTRTASITGGFVALCLALRKLRDANLVRKPPLTALLAAVSVGISNGHPLLDLDYKEDAGADVDMNVARTDDGRYVEIQGTAESKPFSREQFDLMLAHADRGIDCCTASSRERWAATLETLIAPREPVVATSNRERCGSCARRSPVRAWSRGPRGAGDASDVPRPARRRRRTQPSRPQATRGRQRR